MKKIFDLLINTTMLIILILMAIGIIQEMWFKSTLRKPSECMYINELVYCEVEK